MPEGAKRGAATVDLSPVIDELLVLSREKLGEASVPTIAEAIRMAQFFHEGQVRRLDGAPYVTHCFSVARNCLKWGLLDVESVCAALLHDAVEDAADVRDPVGRIAAFSEDVLVMVQALSKIRNLQTGAGDMAATYRRILQASSRDIRVLLIKTFDVLHNSETLEALGTTKAKIKASIGLIYVGVARRLGMIDLADQLVEQLLPHLMPVQSRKAAQTLHQMQCEGEEKMARLADHLRTTTAQWPGLLSFTLAPKRLSEYFVLTDHPGTGQLLRIAWPVYRLQLMVPDAATAWQVLGRMHDTYEPLPRHIRDYMNAPRINGFHALTTRILWEGLPLTVLVVRQSDEHANRMGILAKWGESGPDMTRYMNLLGTLGDSDLRMSEVHAHVLPDTLDVYTPRGDRLTFPVGSVVVDFAYLVHTHLGEQCAGARINGIPCTPETTLSDGDVVEVLTSRGNKPQRAWLEVVRTARAKALIKQALRTQDVSVKGVRRTAPGQFVITELDGPDISWSTCCMAVPGSDIVGRFAADGRWLVHRAECAKTARLADDLAGGPWECGRWALPETAQYHLFVTFALDHRSGALLPVLDLLARRGINGHSIVGKGRSANTFLIEMELEGADPVVLGQVLQDLLKIESLQEIRRYHW